MFVGLYQKYELNFDCHSRTLLAIPAMAGIHKRLLILYAKLDSRHRGNDRAGRGNDRGFVLLNRHFLVNQSILIDKNCI